MDLDRALCRLGGMRFGDAEGRCLCPYSHCTIGPIPKGMEYKVANAQAIPYLGEQRLEIWTEGASAPRGMALQVADVHRPLLSLSRCADLGYESCSDRTCGYSFDHETGEAIPLARKDNLYALTVWVRAAMTKHEPLRTPHDPAGHFARQR